MKLCKRAIEFVQVMNDNGEVRICGWQKDGGIIGRLTENSMEEIYNSTEANLIKERHINKDYSNCNPNACPFVANDNVEDIFIEVDELPKFPPALYLAYENTCNYQCVMCTIPDCLSGADRAEHERKLDKIDDELRKVLPYVKTISANGLGELFASKHILQLLSEWKPIADPSECFAGLETNGSLFNEKNWSKISNLGQYHLSVAITILSFDNDKYQELSGTKLPISNLIDNLHFVKSLREQGIINFLELATVYQEKNFRDLPDFVRRCIEEFGADLVRLRPFEPWREANMQDWYKDVRNEYHPHHQEFLEVMKDPIFKNPKVLDGGGGKPSGLGPEPYPWTRAKYHLVERILCDDGFVERLKTKVHTDKLVIYGMHIVGRALASHLKNDFNIAYCIDRGMHGRKFEDISIYGVNNLAGCDKNATVIVALDRNEDAVISLMEREGYKEVLSIKDLV
ncbi:MAG: radical SAM protein [Lachnospiraceae bacterium]|nr:radical SAM protein [Lachnospiraceae bacterium]